MLQPDCKRLRWLLYRTVVLHRENRSLQPVFLNATFWSQANWSVTLIAYVLWFLISSGLEEYVTSPLSVLLIKSPTL
jgi:hypothetical protein